MLQQPKNPIDMSSTAIDRRLREVSQLYQLGMMLKTAQRIGKVNGQPKQQTPEPKSQKKST
jgi:hypothetical protein